MHTCMRRAGYKLFLLSALHNNVGERSEVNFADGYADVVKLLHRKFTFKEDQ